MVFRHFFTKTLRYDSCRLFYTNFKDISCVVLNTTGTAYRVPTCTKNIHFCIFFSAVGLSNAALYPGCLPPYRPPSQPRSVLSSLFLKCQFNKNCQTFLQEQAFIKSFLYVKNFITLKNENFSRQSLSNLLHYFYREDFSSRVFFISV
jgi:hypothetical protein